MSLPLAHIDDQYEVVAKIKEGGMGEIYKVRHRLLDELRVVKVLHADLVENSELNERFAREARAAIKLRHPNIVQIFDFTLDASGAGLIVMEYIRGTDLKQLIARESLPSIGLTVEIARQGLRALGYLHRHGFVHRDVSPDNLMLSSDVEGRPLVKIIDLGIAKRCGTDSQLTASGIFIGKFRYSSPEHFGAQGSGGIEARSDLYSFGLVLYELLTGQYPIQGDTTSQLIAGHLFQSPRDFSETDPDGRVPESLRQAVFKVLAKQPDERFGSAEELIAALGGLRRDYPVSETVVEESRSIVTGEAPVSRSATTRTAPPPREDSRNAATRSAAAEVLPEDVATWTPAAGAAAGTSGEDAAAGERQTAIEGLVGEVEELLEAGRLIEADRVLFQAGEAHGPASELSALRQRLDRRYQHGVEAEVRSLVSRAEARLDDGDFTRAIEILEKARTTAPQGSPVAAEVEAAADLACRRQQEGKRQETIAGLDRRLRVLIRRQDLAAARKALAVAEQKLGAEPDFEPLRQLVARAVEERIQKLVKQAGVAFEAERFDAAAESLRQVLGLDPGNAWIRGRLEAAEAGRRRQEDENRQLRARDAKLSTCLREAEAARDGGDVLKARLLVAKALELKPGDSTAVTLARSLDQRRSAAELQSSSLRTTPLSPGLMKAYTDIEALRAKGDSLGAWRRLAEAIQEFGEVDTFMKLRRKIAEEILEDHP